MTDGIEIVGVFSRPGATFSATAKHPVAGLVGTMGVTIKDFLGNVVTVRTTAGINEPNPGFYTKTDFVAPTDLGDYILDWDDGATPTPLHAEEPLYVAGFIPGEEDLSRLSILTQAAVDPLLTDEELNDLLSRARVQDRYGRNPTQDGWETTYNLNLAAAQGWLLKAGKCANRYTFTSGGRTFSRSQVFDHCMKMAQKFAQKSGLSSIALRRTRRDPLEPPVGGLAGLPVGNAWAGWFDVPPVYDNTYLNATDYDEPGGARVPY